MNLGREMNDSDEVKDPDDFKDFIELVKDFGDEDHDSDLMRALKSEWDIKILEEYLDKDNGKESEPKAVDTTEDNAVEEILGTIENRTFDTAVNTESYTELTEESTEFALEMIEVSDEHKLYFTIESEKRKERKDSKSEFAIKHDKVKNNGETLPKIWHLF